MEKIIIFTPTLNIGGIERVLLTYAKGLGNRGYEVTYLTASGEDHYDIDRYKNVQFVNLNVNRLRKSLFALIKFFRKNKPDIIFTANDATIIVFLAKLLSGSSARLITSQHNYYDNNAEVGVRQKLVIKYIYPLCHKIIAVSKGIQSMLTEKFKINSSKIRAIYNPIDVSEILELSEESLPDFSVNNYILYVGRLSPVKNLPLLFEAFKNFNQSHPDVKLLIIGDGEEKDVIGEAIIHLSLENKVFLLGVKSNPFPYIKRAKVIALSSISEALPTILLESLALGKTIASTPTYGAIDILKNGQLGYISKSIYGIDEFCSVLEDAYSKPIDNDILYDEVITRYDLGAKIIEFEKLWKER